MRPVPKFLLVAAGFSAIVIIGGRAIGGALETDPRGDIPACFEFREDLHHAFQPNCNGEIRTPVGRVSFATNEDGLRDAPRSEILKEKVRTLVVGDSFVEGWWIEERESVSALLRRYFSGYFINAGLRSTGAVLQALRLERLFAVYKPQKVLWFIHDTDIIDDRLACATGKGEGIAGLPAGFSFAEFASNRVAESAAWVWGGENPLVQGLKRSAYRKAYMETIEGAEAKACDPCRGFRAIGELAQKYRVELRAVLLPWSPLRQAGPYVLSPILRQELLDCLSKQDFKYVDSKDFEVKSELYWPRDFHFTPDGMEKYVDFLRPKLEKWFR